MDLRGFLRPTWHKIILTFILPVYFTYTVQYAMAIPPEKSIWYQFVLYPTPLPIMYCLHLTYSGAQPIFTSGDRILLMLLDYAVPLAVNYIIASSIIFLWRRHRSTKMGEGG